jgi:hypothetical protein
MNPTDPVFPRPDGIRFRDEGAFEEIPGNPGLDVRTWLAGCALAGTAVIWCAPRHEGLPVELTPEQVADSAVTIADALLARLAQPPPVPAPGRHPEEEIDLEGGDDRA